MRRRTLISTAVTDRAAQEDLCRAFDRAVSLDIFVAAAALPAPMAS